MPLSTRPANVVKSPLYCTITVVDNESVLRDPNGLDPSVKNIIDGRYIATLGNPINLIEETVRWRLWSVPHDEFHIPSPVKPRARGKRRAKFRHETYNSDHSSRRIFFFSNSLTTAG